MEPLKAGITATIRDGPSCHTNLFSFPEEKDIYKNMDVAPSLLLHRVSAGSQAHI